MPRSIRLIAGCLAVSVLLTACGAQAPAPTPTPTAEPTVAAAVMPSPTPAPTAPPTVAPSPTSPATARPSSTVTARRTATPAAAVAPAGTAAPTRAEPSMRGLLQAVAAGPAGFGQTTARARTADTRSQPAARPTSAAELAASKVTSFRLQGTVTQSSAPVKETIELLFEYSAPDRLRVVFSGDAGVTAGQPGTMQIEVIAIGATQYYNFDGTWVKSEGDARDNTPDDMTGWLAEAATLPGLTHRGSETLDGEPCDVYAYAEDGMTGSVWIASRDRLLRKVQASGDDREMVLVVTDLNQPVEITAPI